MINGCFLQSAIRENYPKPLPLGNHNKHQELNTCLQNGLTLHVNLLLDFLIRALLLSCFYETESIKIKKMKEYTFYRQNKIQEKFFLN